MDAQLYKKLKEFGKVKANAPLAKFTTFKIGGSAEALLEVSERERLVALLNFLTNEGVDYLVLGGGSNVLLPDDAFEGVVIRNKIGRMDLSGRTIAVESGLGFGFVANFAVKSGLSGLEWSAGLPGTVGGAVRGNAGAAGGALADVLDKVEAWVDGEVVEINNSDCVFGYRDSIFKHNKGVVLKAWFSLSAGDTKKSLLQMQEIVKGRNGRYPPYPSAGSFFKNPSATTPAGKLIDEAGLRGKRVGNAMISNEHGNFVINLEGATQADVLKLVDEVKTRVYNKFQITLEEEVQIII